MHSTQPHKLTFPDTDSALYAKARYHYLLQIIFGETIASDYCLRMSSFAPNEEARAFLLKQQQEEDLHLEMLTEYVGVHPRPEVLISFYLKKMDKIMSDALDQKDYVASVFIQNFIVEGLNISLLRELEHHTDAQLSELSGKILRDEISHMDFGVTEIERILREDKDGKTYKKLLLLQRKVLFYATGLAATLAREAKYLGIPASEFGERTVLEHFERIQKAGFHLPLLDKLGFKVVILFFKWFRF